MDISHPSRLIVNTFTGCYFHGQALGLNAVLPTCFCAMFQLRNKWMFQKFWKWKIHHDCCTSCKPWWNVWWGMPPDPPRFQSFSFKSISMPVIYSCSNLFGRVVSWFWTKIIFQLCLGDTAERLVMVQSTSKPTTPAQPTRLTRLWKQIYLSVKKQTSTVQGPGGVFLEGDFTVHVYFAKLSV